MSLDWSGDRLTPRLLRWGHDVIGAEPIDSEIVWIVHELGRPFIADFLATQTGELREFGERAARLAFGDCWRATL
jgi:hypothetical protein